MENRKIAAMHKRFGTCGGLRCRDCKHCLTYDYHNRRYYKCKLYGLSNSEATDWRLSWPACGMYNMDVKQSAWTPLVEQLRHSPRRGEAPIDGQQDFSSILSGSQK